MERDTNDDTLNDFENLLISENNKVKDSGAGDSWAVVVMVASFSEAAKRLDDHSMDSFDHYFHRYVERLAKVCSSHSSPETQHRIQLLRKMWLHLLNRTRDPQPLPDPQT